MNIDLNTVEEQFNYTSTPTYTSLDRCLNNSYALVMGDLQDTTKIFLDNMSVIDKVNQPRPLHPMQAQWELLRPTQ